MFSIVLQFLFRLNRKFTESGGIWLKEAKSIGAQWLARMRPFCSGNGKIMYIFSLYSSILTYFGYIPEKWEHRNRRRKNRPYAMYRLDSVYSSQFKSHFEYVAFDKCSCGLFSPITLCLFMAWKLKAREHTLLRSTFGRRKNTIFCSALKIFFLRSRAVKVLNSSLIRCIEI